MKPTRRRYLEALSVGAASLLSGCAADDLLVSTPTTRSSNESGPGTATPAPGENSLTIALAAQPRSLDPLAVDHAPSRAVTHHLFEGLFEYEGGLEPVPRLANGPPEPSNDVQRWHVELRPDVSFQDGTAVRAADIAYSFTAPAAENSPLDPQVDMIDQITVIDDRTVEFDLDEPDPSFPHRLTLPVVPEAVREADREAFGRETAMGTGPFELASWPNGGAVRLRRSLNYWADRSPNLGSLTFTTLNRPADRALALRTQEAGATAIPDNSTWSSVEAVDAARILAVPQLIYFYLAFNCLEGPTADRRVREAVDYAFDMDPAVAEHVEPIGVRQYSPVPSGLAEAWDMPIGRWQRVPHEKDVEQAASLFDDAGVPTDYPWRIIVPPDDAREGIARAVAAGLEEAGFTNTTVSRLEWGAFYSRYNSGSEDDYNMFLLGWGNIPDPGAFTYPLFGRTPRVLGITNGCYYGANSDRGVEAADQFARARTATRRSVRRRLYIEGTTKVLEDRAHLPAYATRTAFAVSEDISGARVVPTGDGLHLFGSSTNASLNAEDTTND